MTLYTKRMMIRGHKNTIKGLRKWSSKELGGLVSEQSSILGKNKNSSTPEKAGFRLILVEEK